MRIISKFRDFYDGVQALDEERDLVYVRETTELRGPENHGIFGSTYQPVGYEFDSMGPGNDSYPLRGKSFLIGLCGKIYPCIRLEYWKTGEPNIEAFCYSADDVLSFIEGYKAYKDFDDRERKKKVDRWAWKYSHYRFRSFNYSSVQKWFEEYTKSTKYNKLFFDNKVPVFMLKHEQRWFELTVNPRLADYKFYQMLPVFDVYQKIDMFLANDLAQGEPNMVQISDKDMAAKKGFNKWSFKTMPTKNK